MRRPTNRMPCHRRLFVIAVILLLAAGGWATVHRRGRQERETPLRAATALEAAIADVQAGRRTTPLIAGPASSGDFIVTFLAESPGAQAPRIVSDATGWGENAATDTFDFNAGRMTRVGQTNWYSLETRVAPRARIEYFVVHGRNYRLDPYNPRQQELTLGGPASEFVTPGYTPPERWDAGDAPAGKTTETIIESRALGGSRRVIVYTPPVWWRSEACPLAVLLDGVRGEPRAIEPIVSPHMLDHLIGRGEIEPVVVAFLESQRFGDRNRPPVEAMRRFLTREVPAWAARRYGAGRSAEKRAILGRSAGGRTALDAALGEAGAYGLAGLLIPGRRVALEPDLLPMVAETRQHRIRVAILAGLYDHANLPTARAFRRALDEAGHVVQYIEVPEGHTPSTWRDHLPEVLVALLRPR